MTEIAIPVPNDESSDAELWQFRCSRVETKLGTAEATIAELRTKYHDSFEQLGVKSLSELVTRYDEKLQQQDTTHAEQVKTLEAEYKLLEGQCDRIEALYVETRDKLEVQVRTLTAERDALLEFATNITNALLKGSDDTATENIN